MKEKYLSIHPEQRSDIEALEYQLGISEVDAICKKALEEGKVIRVISSEDVLDQMDYRLVSNPKNN